MPFATHKEYFAKCSPEVRALLEQVQREVQRQVPGAAMCIGYNMPAFWQQRIFLYFAAFKKHIGIYPPVHDANLEQELARYRGPNGNLQFPLAEPIPIDLVTRIARSLAKQYGSRPTTLRTLGRSQS